MPVKWMVLLLAALVFVHVRLQPYAFDDAHIHFRIAQHLVTDGAPYFNTGDAVMATSSIGWTLLLAGLFWAGGTIHTIAWLEAIITTLAVMVYTAIISRAAGRSTSVADAALGTLVVGGALLVSSTGLMETPFALLVAGCGIWCLQRHRVAGYVFLAAAVFVRLELVVLLATSMLWAQPKPRRWLKAILAAGLGALPFVVLDLHFFGTVLPQTIAAKATGYQLTWPDVISGIVPMGSSLWIRLLAALGLAVSLVVFARRRRLTDPLATASFSAGLVILCAYVAAKGLIFEWYPPLYVVLLCWPLAASARVAAGTTSRRLLAVGLVGLTVPAALSSYAIVKATTINLAYAPTFAQGARVQQYLEVGRFLYSTYPSAVLLTTEIGGLGEGFQGTIVDGFGLISPVALQFHPMAVPKERSSGTIGAIPPRFADLTDPSLIVSYDVFDEALRRSTVVDRYQRVDLPLFSSRDAQLLCQAGLPVGLWGIHNLHIYVRKDLPLPSEWPAQRSSSRACQG